MCFECVLLAHVTQMFDNTQCGWDVVSSGDGT